MWLNIHTCTHALTQCDKRVSVQDLCMSVVSSGFLLCYRHGCGDSMASLYVRLMLQWIFAVGSPLPLILCGVEQGQWNAQKMMSRGKWWLGLLYANKLAWVLKCYCRQHQSTIGAWQTRAWSGFMYQGMTNQECKELTLILHNR